ncbi:MAG: SpoIVB peptidase [Ruminococcus sp.]|nr:SpoIVB peptidase [Ruminococcus sp.]
MKKTVKICVILTALWMISGISTAYAGENSQRVILGGQPFGVKFYNDGVMVVELEDYFDGARYVCPAKEGGLQVNDVIKKVNGTAIHTNEELQTASAGCGGKAIQLLIERSGKELYKEVKPKKNTAGSYLLGAWVRDSCAGIGTMTYYDKEHDYFAALGHGICDNDTGALMPLGSAEIVGANISSVTKSSAGKAGSLNGYFTDKTLGKLTDNTGNGIFGTIEEQTEMDGQEVEIADVDEIRVGKAQLLTSVDGDTPRCYEMEITSIRNRNPQNNENFVIKITDERLFAECGGIVQGMSGSPIVQNNKLVGAVTHVLLNNTQEGYGVAAQFMVDSRNS